MENKILRCQDCYNQFIFTVKQQETYALQRWADPIRCPSCRSRKKEIWLTNEEWYSINNKKRFKRFTHTRLKFFK